MSYRLSVRLFLLFASCLVASPVWAQEAELEPNHPCQQAQFWGAVGYPFVLQGSLDPLTEETFDIDFFHFASTAQAQLTVDLEGESTGQGTLADPFVVVLDSSCNFWGFDDDSGTGLNARLHFSVPPDGEFIIAVTACCDFPLQGADQGSYLLTLDQTRFIGSITARMVDSRTGLPLPGSVPPFPAARLEFCDEDRCNSVGFALPDENGVLNFSSDFFGNPLIVGDYRLNAFTPGFEDFLTPLFPVDEGENVDLGDIEMVPLALIGSVSGRLIDALDGHPLSSEEPSFAFVHLFKCNEFECFNLLPAIPDSQGRFRYNGTDAFFFFSPGTYKLIARADQYLAYETQEFEVGRDEDFDLGELRLQPAPIQLLDVQICSDLPPQGGICRFGAAVRNGLDERFSGQAWGMIFAGAVDDRFQNSMFQVGRRGARNPAPQNLNIKPGQSEWVEFEFFVPGSVRPGAFFCPDMLIGQNPSSTLNPFAVRFVSCISKQQEGFALLSEKESRKLRREHDEQQR